MHHGTCVTHMPWCMSGSLTRGGGENVLSIPGACATRNFTYLARGPWQSLGDRYSPPGAGGYCRHSTVPVASNFNKCIKHLNDTNFKVYIYVNNHGMLVILVFFLHYVRVISFIYNSRPWTTLHWLWIINTATWLHLGNKIPSVYFLPDQFGTK